MTRRKAVSSHLSDKTFPAPSPVTPGQKRQGWQRVLTRGWIAFVLMLLVIFVANIPAFFQYAATRCTLPDVGLCPTAQYTAAYVQIFNQLHIPMGVADNFLAAFCVILSGIYCLLGFFIFWRKSREPMGLFVSLLLILFGTTGLIGFNL